MDSQEKQALNPPLLLVLRCIPLTWLHFLSPQALEMRDLSLIKPPISPDPDVANCDCFEENMLDSMGIDDEEECKPQVPVVERKY